MTKKFLIPLLSITLLSYLGYNIIHAVYYTGEYSIDFSPKNFKNSNLPLYIDENYNSSQFNSFGKLGSENYAKINYTPISFVFQPKEFLLKKEIIFSAEIKSTGDWEISTVCNTCSKNQKYRWKPFSLKVLANDNYHLVKYINGFYIYSLENKRYIDANNINEWIEKNIQNNSKILIKTDKLNKKYSSNDTYDFIVADILQSQSNTWSKTYATINKEDISELSNYKNITIKLRSKKTNKAYKNTKEYLSNGYELVLKFNNYNLWSKKQNQKNLFPNNPLSIKEIIYLIKEHQKTIYLKEDEKINEEINNIYDYDYILTKNSYNNPVYIKKINVSIQ